MKHLDKDGQLHSILRNTDRPLANNPACGAGLLATDSKGSVLARLNETSEQNHAYTAYGHALEIQAFGTLLGFNGECVEPVTACYLLGNGYRAYSPVLMRFHSPDSWSPFGRGGLNAYVYCSADPINYSDPSGHVQTLIKAAPPIAEVVPKAPRFLRSKRTPIKQRFTVDHQETLTTTTIEIIGQGETAQHRAVSSTRTRKQTTELFEVIADPHKGPATVHVTRTNLDSFLELSNEIFTVEAANAMYGPTSPFSPTHLNNLQNRRNGLTLWGQQLARRAVDPNDSSAVVRAGSTIRRD
ncbi:RHS repeat-associated core domain-containing protein [Pseudomonas peradeniyensis]|uniref:RHS repeat-associated core domain-containing protein n=1 Tax=Pseudomonas peradeniyensis TaxID=2745488 RepID=A0ABT2V456_9PSED|nr:RHS repeat-associated core domain-containing protein [Pseudomonas peradeniyensis]MCU7236537.1 RHS repeat-associated core domain-containing protein [Pseudomonas peradeniyensis]